jgi:hypothetical protein
MTLEELTTGMKERVEEEEAKRELDELKRESELRRKERQTRESQRDLLEELYEDEYVIDNPPECYERYEADSALAHLRGTIERQHTQVKNNSAEFGEQEIEAAKDTIDIMATYGQLAEKDIAALTRLDLPSEVYSHAIDTLASVREQNQRKNTIRETIGRWLSP